VEEDQGIRIYNNIITDFEVGLVLDSSGRGANDVTISNNTLARSVNPASETNCIRGEVGPLLNTLAFNNICAYLTNTVGPLVDWAPSTSVLTLLDHNVYYDGGEEPHFTELGVRYTGLGPWQTATGMEQSSVVADPQFVNAAQNDLHLQAGSPANTAGMGQTPAGAYVAGNEVIGHR